MVLRNTEILWHSKWPQHIIFSEGRPVAFLPEGTWWQEAKEGESWSLVWDSLTRILSGITRDGLASFYQILSNYWHPTCNLVQHVHTQTWTYTLRICSKLSGMANNWLYQWIPFCTFFYMRMWTAGPLAIIGHKHFVFSPPNSAKWWIETK